MNIYNKTTKKNYILKMKKVNDIWDIYDKIEVIGSGSYSDVYKANNKLT